jgi:hypothetical protein
LTTDASSLSYCSADLGMPNEIWACRCIWLNRELTLCGIYCCGTVSFRSAGSVDFLSPHSCLAVFRSFVTGYVDSLCRWFCRSCIIMGYFDYWPWFCL